MAEQPCTFWNSNRPDEYGFEASKAAPTLITQSEKLIGTGERRPTLPFNGYGEWVAALYS